MDNTILYNPNCSKSRLLLEIVDAYDLSVQLRNYLLLPLTKSEVLELLSMLDLQTPQNLLRSKDISHASLENDQNIGEFVSDTIANSPELLQRPVIVLKRKALIARPPAIAIDFIKQQFEK